MDEYKCTMPGYCGVRVNGYCKPKYPPIPQNCRYAQKVEKGERLDKTKVYMVFSRPYGSNQPPNKRYKEVRILFEDDVSFYVESVTAKDAKGFGMRYSIKKHCFVLREKKSPPPATTKGRIMMVIGKIVGEVLIPVEVVEDGICGGCVYRGPLGGVCNQRYGPDLTYRKRSRHSDEWYCRRKRTKHKSWCEGQYSRVASRGYGPGVCTCGLEAGRKE